jgi:plasmid stabilization system protein ParE
MSFRVEVTAEAERDADAILEWLFSQYAGEAGLRWFAALEDAIQSLAEFSERCALAPENQVFPFEVRQLLYGHKPHVYRILFTVDRSTVHVLQIRHGRRRPAKQ